jgi:DNA-binding beta-propeller fold protein YncE
MVVIMSNDVELLPWHAVQLTGNHVVVSCVNVTNSKSHDVVEVDSKGRQVVISYTNQLESTTQQEFNWPCHLSVDKNNEYMLVADTSNNTIVVLSRSSKCCVRELNVMMSADGGLQRPSRLYFNESQNRLFVGECEGQCRVLVFDNVI